MAGRQFSGQPARLPDYACYLLHGLPYPGLRPQPGAVTCGVLYKGLDQAAWRRLDQFEDDCYSRELLIVESPAGPREAAVYLMKREFYGRLSDEPWSADWFRRHRLAGFLPQIEREP